MHCHLPHPDRRAQCRVARAAALAAPRVVVWLAACIGFSFAAQAANGVVEGNAGRSLESVLRELHIDGVNLIFSSDIVSPQWRVVREPAAVEPLDRVRELLAPYDLALRRVGPRAYAIVLGEPTQQLVGRVLDRASGEPLGTARIELSPGQESVTTDRRGQFVFTRLRPGDYGLRVSRADYRGETVAQLSLPQAGASLVISLTPDTSPISEVVVSASRYQFGGSDLMSGVTLAAPQIRSQPAFGEDVLRATSRIPGLAQNDLSAAAYVRGGDSDEVLVLVDGFPLRQPFHSPGYQSLFSILDPAIVSQMEVFTGGFPARYGNRMSAVFDINTTSDTTKPDRELGLSFFNASARVAGRLPGTQRWDGLGMLRIGTLRYLLNAFAGNTSKPSYSDGFARVHFAASPATDVYGYALLSRDELHLADRDRGENGQVESQAGYVWVNAIHRVGEDAQLNVLLGHSTINSERAGTLSNPGIGTGVLDDLRRSETWDIQASWKWLANPRHQLEGGIDGSYGSANYRYTNAVTFDPTVAVFFGTPQQRSANIIAAPQRRSVAGFLTHRWRISPTLSSEIGLRAQRESGFGLAADARFDPRIALRWQLAPETALRAAWGRFHQADEVFQLRVEDGITAFETAQLSEHMILGIDHRLTNGTRLRLEGFRKTQTEPRNRFENLINPLVFFGELGPDRVRVIPDRAELRGIEVSAEQSREPWSWWATYTYSQAVDDIALAEVPRSWDQRHAVNMGVEWRQGPWDATAIFRAHSGWRTTPIATADNRGNVLGPRNSATLPRFATLDLRLARRWAVNPGELELALQLTNAANRENVCCRDFTVARQPDGTARFLTDAASWLPLLPSLSVRWRF